MKIANFVGKLLQNCKYVVGMRNFQDTSETQKWSLVIAFSIYMTVIFLLALNK